MGQDRSRKYLTIIVTGKGDFGKSSCDLSWYLSANKGSQQSILQSSLWGLVWGLLETRSRITKVCLETL